MDFLTYWEGCDPSGNQYEATELAYFAGLFDGEGTCSYYTHKGSYIRKSDHKEPFDSFSRCITYNVSIANTHLGALQFVRTKFGGSIHARPKWSVNKICYQWQLRNRPEVKNFLIGILPYLVIKRDAALRLLGDIEKDELERSEREEELLAEIKELATKGMGIREIARELKISNTPVSRRFKILGIVSPYYRTKWK